MDLPFEVDQVPFISIEGLKVNDPLPNTQVLAFTSRNAVRYFVENYGKSAMRSCSIYCVGDRTANLVETLGFSTKGCANHAEELLERMLSELEPQTVCFPCGNLRRNELPEGLSKAGFEVVELKVYTTQLTPVVLDVSYDVILFYSPSGVESFVQKNEIGDALCICIGRTTAHAALQHTPNVKYPSRPRVEDAIELLKTIIDDDKE